MPDIDWTRTTAHTTSYCHIFLNIKGRDEQGIVDPADQFELEEKIMTDLYGLRDEKKGIVLLHWPCVIEMLFC